MTAPNAELAYKVLDHIDANPAEWKQSAWKRGSSYCFGGWAVVLSGATVDYIQGHNLDVIDGPDDLLGLDVEGAANSVLGLADGAAFVENFRFDDGLVDLAMLYGATNTREDLGRLVAEIFGPRSGGDA